MPFPTLCLNMIVKNESNIIKRLLESCIHIIDSFCIVDTGSTDNTIELIETFFREKNIPGKIYSEPFRDFGYNRSFALRCATEMDISPHADYLLLLDADMILNLSIENIFDFKTQLSKADAHYIFQGNSRFFHKNIRVIKNNMGYTYWGVTHEYVKLPDNTIYNHYPREIVFIDDRGDGGSKENKYKRDIQLITNALELEPDNDRYYFYLANSYFDTQQYETAIQTYKKRISLGGWFEEVWYSYYRIGLSFKQIGDMERAIHSWMDAYQFFPNRIENLYEIIHYYRIQGKNQLAYMFYIFAKKAQYRILSPDFLFLHKDIYDYKLDYEMTIIGYYCNYDSIPLTTVCINVLNYPYIEPHIASNVMSNYKFYSSKLYKDCYDITNLFDDIGYGNELFIDFEEFIPSTPSIAFINTNGYIRFIVNRRFVNYRIGEKGEYINRSNISTKNVIALYDISFDKNNLSFKKTREFVMDYDKTKDGLYIGLEDVRLFTLQNNNNSNLFYSCNRGISRNHILVETGKIDIRTEKTEPHLFVFPENTTKKMNSIEKNWVMFEDIQTHSIKYIYKWFPLTIGNAVISNNTNNYLFYHTHEIHTPPVFKLLRGSTNGCIVNDEIWFICHTVSYEERRVYYHMIVSLNATDFSLKYYTPFFTFESNIVEYCLGLVYISITDEFIIGYSLMDRQTKYMKIPRQDLVNILYKKN